VADVRNRAQERQVQKFQERGQRMRERATQSPLGPKAAPRRAPAAPVPPAGGVPGGLNVTPEQMRQMDQLMNPPPMPAAPLGQQDILNLPQGAPRTEKRSFGPGDV
jgi:hypothetical protein